MHPIDAIEQAWQQGAPLLADLSPDRLAEPTPCAGWDVADLLHHTVVECAMFTRVNRGEPAHVDGHTLDRGDIAGAWHDAAAANVASWRASGLDGERTYPFGTFPAEVGAVINLGEVVIHAWDLAQATGQRFPLDQELVSIVNGLYANLDMTPYRAFNVFGDEVAVAVDAPELDRLVALLGRTP